MGFSKLKGNNKMTKKQYNDMMNEGEEGYIPEDLENGKIDWAAEAEKARQETAAILSNKPKTDVPWI